VTRAIRPIARRALAAILAGLALAAPFPTAAQRRDPAEAEALLVFITSLAAQKTARFCERAMPEYRQRFDEVYGRWAARHTSRIARGERVFREARAEKDRPPVRHDHRGAGDTAQAATLATFPERRAALDRTVKAFSRERPETVARATRTLTIVKKRSAAFRALRILASHNTS
jgi:hypothetical protein